MQFSTATLSILAALAATTSAYSNCATAAYPYTGKTFAPIPFRAVAQTNPKAGNARVSVNGTIQIIDKCNYSLANVSFTGAPYVKIYGGFIGSTMGYTLNQEMLMNSTVSPAGTTKQFPFVSSAGDWVSYNDFNEFRVFDVTNNFLLAVADIPGGIPSPNTIPPVTSTTPTASPTASPAAKASNSADLNNAGSMFAIPVAYLLSLLVL